MFEAKRSNNRNAAEGVSKNTSGDILSDPNSNSFSATLSRATADGSGEIGTPSLSSANKGTPEAGAHKSTEAPPAWMKLDANLEPASPIKNGLERAAAGVQRAADQAHAAIFGANPELAVAGIPAGRVLRVGENDLTLNRKGGERDLMSEDVPVPPKVTKEQVGAKIYEEDIYGVFEDLTYMGRRNYRKEALESSKTKEFIADLPKLDSKTHREEALKLIESGQGWWVAENLDKFKGLDHKKIALKIIEKGRGDCVAKNLDKFRGLDHKEIALKIIKKGDGRFVVEYLDKFRDLDHKEIALKIIEKGGGSYVAHDLDKFRDLDHKEIALKLIEKGNGSSVAYYLDKFTGLDHKEIASKLIEKGDGNSVAMYLDKFTGLDHKEIALKLIEKGDGIYLVQYLGKFTGLDHKEIALKLIEKGGGIYVAMYLDKFTGLDHKEIALKLIEKGNGWHVVEYLGKFTGLDHKEIALKLIEKGDGNSVAKSLDKFKGLDHKEIALMIIEKGGGNSVAKNLAKFTGLDKKVALKLIENGQAGTVAKNLDKFTGLDKRVALRLIQKGEVSLAGKNLDKFAGLDKEAALKIIKKGGASFVGKNLDKFAGLDKEVALKLIEKEDGYSVVHNLGKFTGLDKEVALKLIEKGYGNSVAKNLDKFEGLDHKEIALKLIENGDSDVVISHFSHFSDLDFDFDLVTKVAELGYLQIAVKILTNLNTTDAAKLKAFAIEFKLPDELAILVIAQSDKEGDLFQNCYESIKGKGDWAAEDEVIKPFERGVAVFGYEKMMKYAVHPRRTPHDVLFGFYRVIDLFKTTEKNPQQFYFSILEKAYKDNGTYDSGTASHELNRIAALVPKSLDDVKRVLEGGAASELQAVKDLALSFTAPEEIFESWNTLKSFGKLKEFLDKKELRQELEDFSKKEEAESDPVKKAKIVALIDYVLTVGLHPTSKVELSPVMQFFKDPKSFFNRDEKEGQDTHLRKKPSNYTQIPHLDLTGTDLRDCIVGGDLDRLQVLPAKRVTYEIPVVNGVVGAALNDLAKISLGSKSKDIAGKAKNSGKLYVEVKKVVGSDAEVKEFLEGKLQLDVSKADSVRDLIFNDKFGMQPDRVIKVVAAVHSKSSPEAALAGSDTSSCMGFGTGKNNVYTCNPIASQFTLQIETEDGNLRTVAQSVLTLDGDARKPVPEIMKEMAASGADIHTVLSPEILKDGTRYVACDNVEVHPNYRDAESKGVIDLVYADFFKAYITENGAENNWSPDYLPIGMNYSPTIHDYPTRPNVYVPLAPLGYSDKIGKEVYALDLTKESRAGVFKREVLPVKVPEKVPAQKEYVKGVSELRFTDCVAVSYLEGKAFEGTSLLTGLHNMENGLIAMEINNVSKGRPNMSFAYRQDAELKGYIFAYEGKIKLDDDSDPFAGIYVSDLTAAKDSTLAGGKLLRAFALGYKANYADKDNVLPIYGEFREGTSYELIQRNIKDLSRITGVEFEIEELGTRNVTGATMHKLLIKPVRK